MGTNIKKKVLFLGVGLYNYDSLICNELLKNYDVSYVYLVPVKKIPKWKYSLLSHLGKTDYLSRLNSELLLTSLKKLKGFSFDYIFVIKGSRLQDVHMDYIERNFPSAKKILYLWDSWSLIENKPVLSKYFKTIYSFDSEDCKKYGFILRPLFYAEKNEGFSIKEYDISFMGTDHSDRLEKLRSFRQLCDKNNLKYFLRLKTTGYPILCARFNYGSYQKSDLDMLTTNFMTYEETMDLTRKSKAVIDFAHPAQCGLTIRTLESLAMGCKLLTSNKYIKEYKDIQPECYCVLPEADEDTILSFLQSEVPAFSLPEKYSISGFIKELLN